MPRPRTDDSRPGGATLGVVICTRNRAAMLRQTLESLCAQTLDRRAFEVVIIDDGSSDDTRETALSFRDSLPLAYAFQRHAGLASAKNHGIFRTLAPLLLFLDDDDVATPALLAEHVVTHERHREDRWAVLGRTALAPELADDPLMEFVTEVGCYLFAYPPLVHGAALDYRHFWGGRSSCKRAMLIEHGLFNPVFRFGCEDIELGYRLSKHGFQVIYNANALSVMTRRIDLDGFCDRLIRQGRSNRVFSGLHGARDVQEWTEAIDADEAWKDVAPRYESLRGSARRLEALCASKRRLGFELSELDLSCLHETYHAAFRASKLKGLHEGLEAAG